MTKGTGKKAARASNPANALVVPATEGETKGQTLARALLEPSLRHGQSAWVFVEKMMGSSSEQPGITDCADYIRSAGEKAECGDLSMASRMLTAQAITLDSMFTEFARRSALTMGEYLETAERYGRLAMKAQSNCRATLEALAKLHQPREQTVRHVHVNDGGQAIVADQFHQHTGASENGKSVKQSDATGATGECAALPCPDPYGDGVPVASGKRQTAMQDARRDESGCA